MPLTEPSLVYVPHPATYATRQVLKAPLLRADVSGAVQLLMNPPFFSGYASSTTTLTGFSETAVSIDTENADPYNGHQASTVLNTQYYPMVEGYYLCESAVPVNDDTGAGVAVTAGIGFSAAGASPSYHAGQLVPTSSTSGQFPMPVSAKIVRSSNAGTVGGATNDYVQATGAFLALGTIGTLVSNNLKAQFQVTWISALAGTPGLIVPANPAWPVPPAYVTSAFMNANGRDAIRFLLYPPIMEANDQGTSQNLASQGSIPAVGTTISMDTTPFDTWTAYNGNTYVWTAPVSGLYYCYCQVGLTVKATSLACAAGLTVTSSLYNSGSPVTFWGAAQATIAASTIFLNAAVVRKRIRLNAGDTVSPAGWQRDSASASATVNVGTGTGLGENRLIIIWVAA